MTWVACIRVEVVSLRAVVGGERMDAMMHSTSCYDTSHTARPSLSHRYYAHDLSNSTVRRTKLIAVLAAHDVARELDGLW